MGNGQQHIIGNPIYEWKEIGRKRSMLVGTPSLLLETNTGLLADCYEVLLQQNLEIQKKVLARRSQLPTKNIVAMIDSRKASESFFECTQTFEGTLQVITEQMLGRVNELNNLSEACALYVLHESLCGFKELVRHAERYFRVLDDMIAWDCSGKIKVWLNSSFGELSIVVDQHVSEAKMVENIWNIIRKCLLSNQRKDYYESLFKMRPRSFTHIISSTEEYLCRCDRSLLIHQLENSLNVPSLPDQKQNTASFFYSTKSSNKDEKQNGKGCFRLSHAVPRHSQLRPRVSFFIDVNKNLNQINCRNSSYTPQMINQIKTNLIPRNVSFMQNPNISPFSKLRVRQSLPFASLSVQNTNQNRWSANLADPKIRGILHNSRLPSNSKPVFSKLSTIQEYPVNRDSQQTSLMRFSHEQKLLQPINKPSIEQIRPEIVDKPSVKSPNIDEGEKLKADMLTPSSSSKSIMSYNDDLGQYANACKLAEVETEYMNQFLSQTVIYNHNSNTSSELF